MQGLKSESQIIHFFMFKTGESQLLKLFDKKKIDAALFGHFL